MTTESFKIFPIGIIKKVDRITIEIYEKYTDALLGLDQFSHIIVFYWFHKSDTEAKRDTLQVHPRGDLKRPLRGVFATRSPVRPNPIGISVCKILSVEKNSIRIDVIDAHDGTPVIDIKPYIPKNDSIPNASFPEWVE